MTSVGAGMTSLGADVNHIEADKTSVGSPGGDDPVTLPKLMF